MTVIALFFCALVMAIALTGVLAPSKFLDIVRRLTTPQGFYLLGILRIAFGAALYVAAPSSRLPRRRRARSPKTPSPSSARISNVPML